MPSSLSRRFILQQIAESFPILQKLICQPQRIDLEFVQWLVEGAVPFSLVFTKADKSKAAVLRKNVALFLDAMKEWSEGEPAVFTSSAKTGDGRREILAFIEDAIQG